MQIYIVAKLVLNTFGDTEPHSYVSYLDNDMKNTHIDNLQWTTERPKLTVVQPEVKPSTDSVASAIDLHCNKALFRDTTEFLIRVSRYILTIDSEKDVVTAASIKKTINVIQTVTLEPILDINALLRLKDLPIDEQHTELRLVYSDFIDTLKRNRVGYQSS